VAALGILGTYGWTSRQMSKSSPACQPNSLRKAHLASRPARETQVLYRDWKRQLRAWSLDACSLLARKPERCPFGHSLARGKPQQISWMPCICGPAQERAGHGQA
jgi:hypothetical protein